MDRRPDYKLKDVHFAYGSTPVLNGIDLDLEAGHFYGIVGPNGAGKSTLIDLLMGIRSPVRGRIEFDGRPVASYSRRALARMVAYVPQEYSINFPFTVRELVMMGRHPYMPRFGAPSGEDLDKVEEVLRLTGMSEMASKPVTELSGGGKAASRPRPCAGSGHAGPDPGRTHGEPGRSARPGNPDVDFP